VNERLAVLNPLPMTRSMKQFAENLRLRDISRLRWPKSRTPALFHCQTASPASLRRI
jgi:hypothetical protein